MNPNQFMTLSTLFYDLISLSKPEISVIHNIIIVSNFIYIL